MAARSGSRGEMRQFWRTFSRNQLAMCGGAVVLVLVTLAVLAPLLAPWDPNRPDTKKILSSPSSSHWLGTDPLGRDVLSDRKSTRLNSSHRRLSRMPSSA